MRTRWVSLALATSLIMVGGNVAVAAERFEDAIGDALGDAPDIVAVTVDDELFEANFVKVAVNETPSGDGPECAAESAAQLVWRGRGPTGDKPSGGLRHH